MEWILQPWPWYVSGPLIGLILISMLLFGKTFGFSSNFRTMCSMMGAGKNCSFFDFDHKAQRWNLLFLVGSVIGGALASMFLMTDSSVQISEQTIATLNSYGINSAGQNYLPSELFSMESLTMIPVLLVLILGGFLVGFGTRYAGGCTSGHAITGLSNLQLPSLIAVVGFFIGGLSMTYFVLPYLLPIITGIS